MSCRSPRFALGLPDWFWYVALIQVVGNLLAIWASAATAEVMHGTSTFAVDVMLFDRPALAVLRVVAFPACAVVLIGYLWPALVFACTAPTGTPAPLVVRQRLVSVGIVAPLVSWSSWVISVLVFPLRTWWVFGRWSPDLVSQQVFSPLVAATLAAVATYLLTDLVFRRFIVPEHFPDGRVTETPGVVTLGVRGRLIVFVLAVSLLPLFTMLGLAQATAARVRAGFSTEHVLETLTTVSWTMFLLYTALSAFLTVTFARSLTAPLIAMAGALRRIRSGNYEDGVTATAADEIGLLEDGVNDLRRTLQDRERILTTFGRLVEPAVRDRVLSGDLEADGELRTATVLFCDLRGFTEVAERSSPGAVIATLNEFFTVMTEWMRAGGGFVDKFMGDAMLVVFGLFATDADDGRAGAAEAVRCALGAREQLRRVNERRAQRGQPPLAMGMGVHTGEVVAGTIGAADRHEFTVIGDAVNVASRLQTRCREEGTDLLVSAATWRLAQAAGLRGVASPVEAVALRGRRDPVEVVRLQGDA